jgi:hypothetical protein
VDSGASKYTYDPTGDRVRKDTGTNFTEYYHFGGSVLAEQDQAGHWTDYIYAGGKRIAKTTCSVFPYLPFPTAHADGLNNGARFAGFNLRPG